MVEKIKIRSLELYIQMLSASGILLDNKISTPKNILDINQLYSDVINTE